MIRLLDCIDRSSFYFTLCYFTLLLQHMRMTPHRSHYLTFPLFTLLYAPYTFFPFTVLYARTL